MEAERQATIPRAAYSVRDAAQALSLSENTVWNLLRDGLLARVKVGRRTLITAGAISAFLVRQSQGVQ